MIRKENIDRSSLQSVQGSGPNGRIVAEDVEKFLKEGGAKAKPQATKAKDVSAAPSKPAKKEKETATRAAGYDEQKVSELRAVSGRVSLASFSLFFDQEYARRVTESKTTIPHYYLSIQIELDEIIKQDDRIGIICHYLFHVDYVKNSMKC